MKYAVRVSSDGEEGEVLLGPFASEAAAVKKTEAFQRAGDFSAEVLELHTSRSPVARVKELLRLTG